MTTRALHITMARTFIAECRRRSRNPIQRSFCFLLPEWAANRRKLAMNTPKDPEQLDLFGGTQ